MFLYMKIELVNEQLIGKCFTLSYQKKGGENDTLPEYY